MLFAPLDFRQAIDPSRISPRYATGNLSWLSSARGHFVTGQRVKRPLAAVLAADGRYSRLMGADVAGKVTPREQFHAALRRPAAT